MGLFSSIGKFVGGALKTAGSILPGPVGGIAKIAGGIIAPPKVRPAQPPGITPAVPQVSYVPTPMDRLTGRSDATSVKGILSNTIRYSPFAGAANAFSDFTGVNVGQSYAANPAYTPALPAHGGIASDLMSVAYVQEARAPKGFRVHTVTPSTAPLLGMQPGEKVAVRLGSTAARILGVKRSKKPVISVRDSEALRRAARAKKKLARVSKGAGLHVYQSARSTSTRKR